MGQCRSHLAQRGEASHMKQLLLLLLYSGLRFVPLSEIAAEAGKEASRPRVHLADGKFHGKRRAVLAHPCYGSAQTNDPALARAQIPVQIFIVLLPIG